MPDFRIIQIASLNAITLDWALTPTGQLDETAQLQTGVIVALGTDRRALDDDPLPGLDDDDRRGWWGDMDADVIWSGWPVGTRLWLLARAKIVDSAARGGATVTRVETYVREALQPIINAGVATKMLVQATRSGISAISCSATLFRGPKAEIQLQFQDLWNEIAGTGANGPLIPIPVPEGGTVGLDMSLRTDFFG